MRRTHGRLVSASAGVPPETLEMLVRTIESAQPVAGPPKQALVPTGSPRFREPSLRETLPQARVVYRRWRGQPPGPDLRTVIRGLPSAPGGTVSHDSRPATAAQARARARREEPHRPLGERQ
jgi:hypothetical protein